MINDERAYILEEECLLVRHSGEIPEVALHGSFYYLSEDEEGPRLVLSAEERRLLQEAALARYREIILRDLDVANRDLSVFRGIRRALHNWYRFVRFSDTINASFETFRVQAAQSLIHFLQQEYEDARTGQREASINCSAEALRTFAHALGITPASFPPEWQLLCEKEV